MKTKEELNTLKEEVETMSRKRHELTDEELVQVSGGVEPLDLNFLPVVEPGVIEDPVTRLRIDPVIIK